MGAATREAPRTARPSRRAEAIALEHAYDQVDYVSCHPCYEELDGDLASFLAAARHARSTVLRVEPVAPVYETARFGEVPVIDAVATYGPGAEGPEELTVLAVNRHQTDAVELAVDLRAFPGCAPVEHSVLADPDLRATSTPHAPDRVRPRGVATGPVTDGRLTASLPPVSWNVIRLRATAG